MSRPSVGIRLDVLGKREVVDALRDAGREGQRMADRIEKSGPPASKSLRTLDAAAGELRGGLSGLAAESGGVGRALGSLGKFGAVAAVGLGAITVGAVGLYGVARRATSEVAAMADQADRLGVSSESLQKWQYATAQFNVDGETTAGLMGEIANKAVEAAQGGGEAAEVFDRLGVSVLRADGSMKSMDELLPDIADGFQSMDDPMARVNAASALFGDEGRKLIPLLSQGADGLKDMGDEAERAGLILSDDMVSAAQAANREFERQADIIQTRLRNAFVELGPTIGELIPIVAGFVNAVIEGIMRVLDLFGIVDRRRVEDLQPRVDSLEQRRSEILGNLSQQDLLILRGDVPAETYTRNGDPTALENLRENTAELSAVESEIGELRAEISRLLNPESPSDTPPPRYVPPSQGDGSGGGGADAVDPNAAAVAAMDRIWARVEESIEVEKERMEVTKKANEALRDLTDKGIQETAKSLAEATLGMRDFTDVFQNILLDLATDLPALLTGGTVSTGAGGIAQSILGGVGSGIVNDSGGTIGDWVAGLMGFSDGGGFEVTERSSQMRIPARGGDDRLVAFRAQLGERVNVSRRGQSGGGDTINQNIIVEGDATDATIERMRSVMREEIAMQRPGIVQQSVAASGREIRKNPDYGR